MDDFLYDYALIGLNDSDVMLSGPYEDAVGLLSLMAKQVDSADKEKLAGAVGVVQRDEAAHRATLVVVAYDHAGNMGLSAHVMVPVPRFEDRDAVVSLTDVGRWQLEMDRYLSSVEDL